MRPEVLCRLLMACSEPVVCTSVASTSVIVLGGTRNVRDVLDDLNVMRCEYGDGNVHCGMMMRSRRLWDEVVEEFVHDCNTNLHITGWSLGGGCAIHMAALMHSCGVRMPTSITTFGAPKCADASFVRWYASTGLGDRTTRYELARDPVVTLPHGRGYRHAGRRVRLTSNDDGNLLWRQHELHIYYDSLIKTSSPWHPSGDG